MSMSRVPPPDTGRNCRSRVAMSWAIFALGQEVRVKIHNFETVNTSFPNFISLIKSIGGIIEIKKE